MPTLLHNLELSCKTNIQTQADFFLPILFHIKSSAKCSYYLTVERLYTAGFKI